MSMNATPVVIHDYDPRWPLQFELFRSRIAAVLGNMAAAIEHFGSTAVPGLAAKPIIDMDVLLVPGSKLPEAIAKLAAIGYRHQGDLGIAGREAFQVPAEDYALTCTFVCRRVLNIAGILRFEIIFGHVQQMPRCTVD
jgi:GrpB-like predicted nucleotidyltransferase (UPF0157 family)